MDDQGLEYWGIISVELIKGEVDFYRIREAKPNPKAKLKNKMSLLWKSDFSHILSGNKLPKYAQKSKKFITENLLEKVPEEITRYMTSIIRQHIVFNGWVQGVGFRYRARHAAEMYGVTGWVRNDPSGSVTMEVQGTEEQISNVIIAVERGTYIRIEDMKVKTIPVNENERGFHAIG